MLGRRDVQSCLVRWYNRFERSQAAGCVPFHTKPLFMRPRANARVPGPRTDASWTLKEHPCWAHPPPLSDRRAAFLTSGSGLTWRCLCCYKAIAATSPVARQRAARRGCLWLCRHGERFGGAAIGRTCHGPSLVPDGSEHCMIREGTEQPARMPPAVLFGWVILGTPCLCSTLHP